MLAPAKIGAAYRAELPVFGDPTGHGLTLHATPAPPAGLTFKDLGGGRGEIVGQPLVAGPGAFDVVAVTQAGRSAHMKVTMNVASKRGPGASAATAAKRARPRSRDGGRRLQRRPAAVPFA